LRGWYPLEYWSLRGHDRFDIIRDMRKIFQSAHWKRKDSVLQYTGKIMKLVNFVGASLLVVFAGCGTLPADNENGERKKLVVIADVCKTNGFISARKTNTDAISAAGFLPVLIPNLADTNTVAAIMDRADALVLTGAIRSSDYPVRNRFEFMLIDMAIERGLPVVGFCRGHQMINRYFGGKIASIPKDRSPKVKHRGEVSAYIKDCFHEVEIVPGTRLEKSFGARRATVNTSHSFHVTELAEGLVVTARSDDGVIEAFEHKTLPVTGFQFHPERIYASYPGHLRAIRDAINHPAAGKR
jgi:gamma-glutamyl-gamma-aminobutyrate hydrolase PuuD